MYCLLSTSHLTAPFEVNMKKDSGKDAYLKANADGENVSITVGGFKDKEGNAVVMEGFGCREKSSSQNASYYYSRSGGDYYFYGYCIVGRNRGYRYGR